MIYYNWIVLAIILVILFFGAKRAKRGEWNDEFLSYEQTKYIQGFIAICIMLHHISQKVSANWIDKKLYIPGLDIFTEFGYFFVSIFIFCSGYGLYKSYKNKPDYFKGFFSRRIIPLIVAFYTSEWIFLIARYLLKEEISGKLLIQYITGIRPCNPNSWYVEVMPLFYLAFFLIFRFCKNENISLILITLFSAIYIILGLNTDHNVYYLRGEWWYNSVHLFPIGIIFARFEKKILSFFKKYYYILLILVIAVTAYTFIHSEINKGIYSYYGETFGAKDTVYRRWMCLYLQEIASCGFTALLILMNLKYKLGNAILSFFGKMTLEFYLIHGLFVELFSYSFATEIASIYRITSIPLYIFVVTILSIPSALLIQKLDKAISAFFTGKNKS